MHAKKHFCNVYIYLIRKDFISHGNVLYTIHSNFNRKSVKLKLKRDLKKNNFVKIIKIIF